MSLTAQRDISVAEMSQGDNFTRHARPAVVYFGLLFIGMVHVVFPILASFLLFCSGIGWIGAITHEQLVNINAVMQISLPTQFWLAWGGVVGIWEIGRSAEKSGLSNKVVDMVMGKKS